MQKAADVRSGNRAALVFVVTNDEPVRVMLSQILKAAGLAVEFYTSGMAFLERPGLDCFGCLLLDASASGTNGLDVQACLNERRVALPAIFLYEYVDVPFIVAAVRSGVMDFVEKPFDGEYLLELVRKAITLGGERLDDDRSRQQVLARLNTLTMRERGVMELIVAGKATPSVNAQGLNFGNYDPFDRSSLDGAGNLSINCDKDIAYTISLNGGQGRLNERRMTAGAYSLEYNLYTDASRTLVWGDGTGTSSTVSGSGTVSSLPIYGRIPAGQNGHVGSYSDTVVLSIDF